MVITSRFPDTARPGLGNFVERLVLELAELPEVEVHVLAAAPASVLGSALSRPRHPAEMQETWRGVEVTRLCHSAFPRILRWQGLSMRRRLPAAVASLHERRAFDIISAQFLWPEGPAALAAARHVGIPLSLKCRGHDLDRWRRYRQGLPDVRRADGFLAVSDELKARMVGYGFPAERIKVHRTGIDADLFPCRSKTECKAALGVDGPLVLAVGNLVANKDHRLALDAIRLVEGATLLIAGEGPERARLAERIAQLGLQRRVRLLGNVPHEQMGELYGAADVLLHTARIEGLSNSWVESLASGTPVVTTPAGAAREVIREPSSGRIVERDAAALASAVTELLQSPPDPSHVSATVPGRTWRGHAETLCDHFAELIARGTTPPGSARIRSPIPERH